VDKLIYDGQDKSIIIYLDTIVENKYSSTLNKYEKNSIILTLRGSSIFLKPSAFKLKMA